MCNAAKGKPAADKIRGCLIGGAAGEPERKARWIEKYVDMHAPEELL